MVNPYLSIVVPVYNEEDNLNLLYTRIQNTLDRLGKSYEIIFVNDGSRDGTESLLNQLYQSQPQHLKIIHFNSNFGQHMATVAGFEQAKGEIVITLDADLQNPPEEIPKLVKAIESGHDCVGGVRKERKDSKFRRYASKLNNKIRAKITGIIMTDQGCMLRAYKRSLVDIILSSKESTIYVPALAYTYASNPVEIEVEHHAREQGKSKYNLFRLLRLNFDLMTGFSLVPLQIFTIVGMLISVASMFFVIYLLLRRLWVGPEVEGVFTLFAVCYFLIGILLMGLGILGEYIGRIYKEVQQRPPFIIREVLENDRASKTISH